MNDESQDIKEHIGSENVGIDKYEPPNQYGEPKGYQSIKPESKSKMKIIFAVIVIAVIVIGILLFVLMGGFHGGQNEQAKLYSIKDIAQISQRSPDYNYGSTETITVRNEYGATHEWGEEGLIKFDLSSISPGSTISSAKLKIYYSKWNDNNPSGRKLNLYRITSDWDEDMVTWNNQPSYATQPTADSSVPSATGVWMSWDVTDDVQDFVNGQATNYGWKITDGNYWGTYNIPMVIFKAEKNDYLSPYIEIS